MRCAEVDMALVCTGGYYTRTDLVRFPSARIASGAPVDYLLIAVIANCSTFTAIGFSEVCSLLDTKLPSFKGRVWQ